MSSLILNRELGTVSPQSFRISYAAEQIDALQASSLRISLPPKSRAGAQNADAALGSSRSTLQEGGANALAIDKFEGRFLISGKGNGKIDLWDLESSADDDSESEPISSTARTGDSHRFGVTSLCFYPFDSLAFLSSSFDHTLRLYSTETLTSSAVFNLPSIVHSHAMSSIADHLLVACATEHPAVRLVDLKSGMNTHSLVGHSSAVLSVAWSSTRDHILASGGSDGVVRIWDVRRSAACLSCLDMNHTTAVVDNGKTSGRDVKSHTGAVNGLAWTADGRHLISAGHDERLRVWDMMSGANTLVNFGPAIKNRLDSTLVLALVPKLLLASEREILLYPTGRDILMLDVHKGILIKRLRLKSGQHMSSKAARHDSDQGATAVSWRANHVELYSAHPDGSIRSWLPDPGPDLTHNVAVEDHPEDEHSRKRKRQVLEDIYREFMRG